MRSIVLRRMDQIFPSPVDNIDTVAAYASDDRPRPEGRPWVMCNMISSVDGGIALNGVSGGLGGPADKDVFRAIRAVADVIIVGAGTAVAENYRRPQTPVDIQAARTDRGQSALPRIAIVSNSLRIEPDHRVFDQTARPLVVTAASAPPERYAELAEVADIVVAGAETVDLRSALSQLAQLGAGVALLEGGPTLNGAFVDADLLDELCLSFSPMMLGGSGPRVVAASSNTVPRTMRLVRTLHQESFLFHRYVRDRD
jgi:riboflavin-specific deaminase-like protein